MVGVVREDNTDGYEGRKECDVGFGDSRLVLCGCQLLPIVRVVALVILIQVRPANVDSPSDFYFKQILR